jgi:outer membrane immunogenic protein
MKKMLLLGAALGALAAVSPATAKPPVPPMMPANDWTGFYIGGNAGYSWGTGNWGFVQPSFTSFGLCCALPTAIGDSHNINGAIGGVQAGYNQQYGSWVLGLVTDFQWSGETGSSSFAVSAPGEGFKGTISSKIQWFGTTRANAGLLFANTWVYATAGIAYASVNVSGAGICACVSGFTMSFDQTELRTGPAFGVGIQGKITSMPSLTWMVEYLHIDYGTITVDGVMVGLGPFTFSDHVTDNVIRAGLNWKVSP